MGVFAVFVKEQRWAMVLEYRLSLLMLSEQAPPWR